MTKDDIFEIKEKKVTNIATKKGIILKVIYRFYVSEVKPQRCVISVVTQNGISKLSSSISDAEGNPLDLDILLAPKELMKFINTKQWIIDNFRKEHPEIKKFILK